MYICLENLRGSQQHICSRRVWPDRKVMALPEVDYPSFHKLWYLSKLIPLQLVPWIGLKKSFLLSVQLLQNQPALDRPLWIHNSSQATFQQSLI